MSNIKLYELVGKKGIVQIGGLKVEIKVIDVKNVYGRDRYLVTPISGSGQVWIENVIFTK